MNTLAIVVFGCLGAAALLILVDWVVSRWLCPECEGTGYVIHSRWDKRDRCWRMRFDRCPRKCQVSRRGARERRQYEGEKL